MWSSPDVVNGVGLSSRLHRSRLPARLDVLQGATGLILALFMWGHMLFVASILLSRDAMWVVARLFEGYFLIGRPAPLLVSSIVAAVLLLVVTHALLALRKLPASQRQYHAFRGHMRLMRHSDTTLWWVQCWTGFALFFLVGVHLHQMLMHPGDIGPYESADRVYSGRWWPFYLVTLFCVELHAGIGLYRLAMKWGWLQGPDPDRGRRRLQRWKWALTAFFLALGLVTLAAYARIGHEHRHAVGERYVPAWLRSPPAAPAPWWWPGWLEAGQR